MTEFAQARKDAARMLTFVKSLTGAVAIFEAATTAQALLKRLEGHITEARAAKAKADETASRAERKSAEHVQAADEASARAEQGLIEMFADAASKREALEQEMKDERLAFVGFKAGLERDMARVEEQHRARVGQLIEAEKIARAAVERAEEQRQRMLSQLGSVD